MTGQFLTACDLRPCCRTGFNRLRQMRARACKSARSTRRNHQRLARSIRTADDFTIDHLRPTNLPFFTFLFQTIETKLKRKETKTKESIGGGHIERPRFLGVEDPCRDFPHLFYSQVYLFPIFYGRQFAGILIARKIPS